MDGSDGVSSGSGGRDGTTVWAFTVALALVELPAVTAGVVLTVVSASDVLRLARIGSGAAAGRFAVAGVLLVAATAGLLVGGWGAVRDFRGGVSLLRCLRWPLLATPVMVLGMFATLWAVQA